MFVIVDMSDCSHRRFEKYRKHPITTRRCDVYGSAPFFVAECHRAYYDRDTLENIIKRCGAAIFRDGIIPAGFEKYDFKPSVLPLKLITGAAAEYFENAPSGKKNRKVCIFDRRASAVSEAAKLSRHVRFVRVVTDRPDVYAEAQKEVYDSSGAVLAVGNRAELADGCDCVTALSDAEFNPQTVGCALVYSKKSICGNVFSPRAEFTLPQCAEKEKRGVDLFRFLCALYETCGYKPEIMPYSSEIKTMLDFFI